MTVEQKKQQLVRRAQDLNREIDATSDPWRMVALGEDLKQTVEDLERIAPASDVTVKKAPVPA